MVIAFFVISNAPTDFEVFCRTFNHAMVAGHEYIICASLQMPEYEAVSLDTIRNWLPTIVELRTAYRKRMIIFDREPVFHYTDARLHVFSLLDLRQVDYLIVCDDDFKFTNGQSTNLYKYSSGERYMDCFQYLETNPACGCIIAKHHLGGGGMGRKIVPMMSGFFETARGIILRGRNRSYSDIIDPRLIAPGIGEDVSISITPIINGLYTAKAMNTTTHKKPTTKYKFAVTAGNAWQLEFAYQKGVFAQIEKLFGDFNHGGRLPERLLQHYRETAARLGHTAAY